MAKRIVVTVRRSVMNSGHYDVTVNPIDDILGGPQRAATSNSRTTPEDAVNDIGRFLQGCFDQGDSIEYCNCTYDNIEDAIRSVEVARVDWE